MATTKLSFGHTMAESYEALFVPLMFAPCADVVTDRIKAMGCSRILETAAGTGILTRGIAHKLSPEVKITATDISQPMIDVARAKMKEVDNVTWIHADASKLPFANEAFDLVVCQFGIMFFPDKVAALVETARVLESEGRCVFVVWNDWMKMEEAPLRIAIIALAKLLKCDPISLVNPSYFDEETIRRDFAAAHCQDVKIEHITLSSTADSAREGAMAMVFGSLIRNAIEKQSVVTLDEARAAVEEVLSAAFGTGSIEGRTKALIITARKS